MIKGAIFDMDGTLANSEEVIHRAWSEVLKQFGKTFPLEEYKQFVGGINLSVGDYLMSKHSLQIKKYELYEKRDAIVHELFQTGALEPMPFALEAVEFFCSSNLPVGLATSTERDETIKKLTILGLESKFRAIMCREDVENRKPHPEIYLKTSALIGLKPEECVAFEDTLTGVRAAKGAGCFTIAIPNQLTNHLDFTEADMVFESLKEAISWVRRNL